MADYVKYTKDNVKLLVNKAKLEALKKEFPDRYFEDFGIIIKEDGVVIRKWKYGENYERVQTFVKYKSLDAILRFLGKYYPKSYRKESRKLTRIKRGIKVLNRRLGNWKELSEVEKEMISGAIVELAEALPDPKRGKNELKQEARADLLRAHDFRDCRGRINPGAMRTVLAAAYNKLGLRVNQLDRIRFEYEFKKMLLNGIRREFEKRFMKARTKLKAVKKSLEEEKLNYGALGRIQDEIQKELVEHLGKIVLVPPYGDYFSELHRLLSVKLRSAKAEELIDEALSEAENALEHIRQQQVQIDNLE